MEKLDWQKTLQALAKALNKPCMYVAFESSISLFWQAKADDPNGEFKDLDWLIELHKAAPYIKIDGEDSQFIGSGQGIIVFDSYAEMVKAFRETVGDDGPTKTNPYDGPIRVYALTCNAQGQLENENT